MDEHQLLRKAAEEIAALRAENETLKESLEHSHNLIAQLKARLDILDQRLATRAHKAFVTGSERFIAEPEIEEPEEQIPEDTQFDEAEAAQQSLPEQKPKPKRRPSKRIAFDPAIPREDVVLDPQEYEKRCASCGEDLSRIGEDVSEILEYVPATLKVLRYIRGKYACSSCKGSSVLQSPAPSNRIIRGGMAGNGLVAASLSDKFIYHLPYARQSIRFSNCGFPVSRQNLSRWQMQVSELLGPLVGLIEKHITAQDVIHMDETTLQVSYRYFPTRAYRAADELLTEYEGMIQTDAYGVYRSLVKNRGGTVKQAFCLAHARRKFYDIFTGTKGKRGKQKHSPTNMIRKTTETILKDIGEIFSLESELREKLYNQAITEDEFLKQRKKRAAALFSQLKAHIDQAKANVIPKTPLDGAITYTLNQWEGLQTYLETPLLTPDNSVAERAVRPVALGRRNWTFSGSPSGAKSSCDMYTILQTAALNNLDPGSYLHHLLDKATVLVDLPYEESQWRELLPWKVDPDSLSWQDRMNI
jgi:transposase